ncbi:iron ABC transporter permease [Shewanella sp. KT0246]|uniref:FecCD family ABC transporter permease n=1 Tax=Shewanella sp. KT0246 TaxID=2815912 RepID=UPI001BC289C1|nr:iron ABC transporter permease [Shewanella sp. KT0246]GIU48249.1 ABC transporter permease [Shewanella sp. KT0246]
MTLAASSIKYKALIVTTALLTLITPIAAASFGAANISFEQVFSLFTSSILGVDPINSDGTSAITQRIVFELRLPRIMLAFIAGAGLALAGSVLQTVTRNPLADPYLFGISSGASFGAVLVLSFFGSQGLVQQWLAKSGSHLADAILRSGWFNNDAWWSWSSLSLPVGAFIGACFSVLLVLSLSGFGRASQVERMLLSGVATSFMFGALTSLVLYFSSPQAAASVLFWSLGSFAKASWQGLVIPAVVVSSSILIILAFKRQVIAIQAGDETAHSLGVNVSKLRLYMLILCSLITAVLVASCGGIGFVGLMIPHTVRLLFPGQQPILTTALVGGLFMVWIDVLARCLLANQELPVGIITAAIGSVFFLFVLRHRR